jgi:hypothetical protein
MATPEELAWERRVADLQESLASLGVSMTDLSSSGRGWSFVTELGSQQFRWSFDALEGVLEAEEAHDNSGIAWVPRVYRRYARGSRDGPLRFVHRYLAKRAMQSPAG